MTELKEAMYNQMAYLVLSEHRPFCANDLLRFVCDNKEYTPNYGTIRNIFSEFKDKGQIEFCFRDINAYYSLKGQPFAKNSMTVYHTWGNNSGSGKLTLSPSHALYKLLKNQIFDMQAIHNIRLRLEVPGIYNNLLQSQLQLDIKPASKDIETPYQNVDNAQLQIRIHKTDTVSVVLACTLNPIPLDYNGLCRLYKILGIAQGYQQGLIGHDHCVIPDCDTWLITMWHFNRDALKQYKGKTFWVSVEEAHHTIHTIYTKIANNKKTRIRDEIQEYPNKTVKETIDDKLRVPAVPDSSNIQMHNVQ
jgi:hypothetical protein